MVDKTLKEEIIEYIDKEHDHLEEKFNNKILSLEKITVKIEDTLSSMNSRIYSDAQLREISSEEFTKHQKGFWGNLKWFIGITITTLLLIAGVGIVTWSNVRDYVTFKDEYKIEVNNIKKNIQSLMNKDFNQDIQEILEDIDESIQEINEKIDK